MAELFHALGINASGLLIQAINFGIVLVVLTLFVYRPLSKIVEERRKKIELGIEGGERAALIVKEAEEIKEGKIREGEKSAIEIITKSEAEGQKRSQEIVHGAEKKAQYIVEEALSVATKRKQEEMEHVAMEARALVKEAIIKTVKLSPDQVDEELIQQAIHEIHS